MGSVEGFVDVTFFRSAETLALRGLIGRQDLTLSPPLDWGDHN